MSTTDDATPLSQYVSPTERVILEATSAVLREINNRVSNRAYLPDVRGAETLNLGGLRARIDCAAEAIDRALISLDVNAEHYPSASAVAPA